MSFIRTGGFNFSTFLVLVALCLGAMVLPAKATAKEEGQTAAEAAQVLEGFHAIEEERRQSNELTTKEKHQIMFLMGISLLVLLLLTAYFGIATGVYGKPLFVPHMVCAGLSVTLAIAHSVVAVVWFYPY